jgi:hypothetical protein
MIGLAVVEARGLPRLQDPDVDAELRPSGRPLEDGAGPEVARHPTGVGEVDDEPAVARRRAVHE